MLRRKIPQCSVRLCVASNNLENGAERGIYNFIKPYVESFIF